VILLLAVVIYPRLFLQINSRINPANKITIKQQHKTIPSIRNMHNKLLINTLDVARKDDE